MLSVLNSKQTIVMGVVVIMLLLLQIESFAGQDWERITELPTKRINFATAVVEDKMYLIGGTLYKNVRRDKAVRGPYGISTVERYDPQTNTWKHLAEMPTPRELAKAAVVNGTIYVFGGLSAKQDGVANMKFPVRVEAYNPKNDTWIRKQDMPVSRVKFDVGVVAGKVYIIGGAIRFNGERINRVDVYDPATDTWMKGKKMPTPRAALGVEVVKERLYAIGGRGWPPDRQNGPYLQVIEAYNPVSRQWHQKNDMLDIRYLFSSVVVEDDIYLIGGKVREAGFFGYLATVDVYSPHKDAWGDIPALPIPVVPQGTAAVNGRIYVLGGTGDIGNGWDFFPDVVVFNTGSHAVEANGKLSTRWGELKAAQQQR